MGVPCSTVGYASLGTPVIYVEVLAHALASLFLVQLSSDAPEKAGNDSPVT